MLAEAALSLVLGLELGEGQLKQAKQQAGEKAFLPLPLLLLLLQLSLLPPRCQVGGASPMTLATGRRTTTPAVARLAGIFRCSQREKGVCCEREK